MVKPVKGKANPVKTCLYVLFAVLTISAASATAKPASVMAYKWSLWTGQTQLRGANIYQRRVYTALDGPTFLDLVR